MSVPTSDDESLPSDSDSENEITVLNSPAVKIVDHSIDKTKALDLMAEKWSKFCQSEAQLQEMLCYNTFTGEIVEIIGIFERKKANDPDRYQISLYPNSQVSKGGVVAFWTDPSYL